MRRKNGSGTIQHGYVIVFHDGKYVREHRYIAEKALGRPLPKEAVVHHWDEDRSNNSNDNLLICPDVAYHNLIHARMAAMEATGDPNKRKCEICRCYDDVVNLRDLGSRNRMSHIACSRAAGRATYARRKDHGTATENADTNVVSS